MDLIDELHSRVLCGDGAMGTALMEAADASFERCLEEFCLSAPELVTRIHGQYIDAGARVIETNSFGANAARLERHGLEGKVNEINWTAAQLARQAAQGKDVYVAGSVGPLGSDGRRGARTRHRPRAPFSGTDRRAARRRRGPDFLRDVPRPRRTLPRAGGQAVAPPLPGALLAGVRGGRPPAERHADHRGVRPLARARARRSWASTASTARTRRCACWSTSQIVADGDLLSAYPNAGYPRYYEGRFLYYSAPDYFAKVAREMVEQGVAAGRRLLRHRPGADRRDGGRRARPRPGDAANPSSGPSSPRRSVEAQSPRKPSSRRGIGAPARAAAGGEETSILDLIAQGKTVVITELDPPKTMDLEKFLAGAQALTAAGSDAITLADNSLAILRVSNLAAGALLKQRHGIMPLLHISAAATATCSACKAS